MKALLIPLVLLIFGVGGGVGAGLVLAPPAPAAEDVAALDCPAPSSGDLLEPVAQEPEESQTPAELAETRDYAKLNNQFVIPVVEDGRVAALVVMSLSIEVDAGQTQLVYSQEPKLRDSFLQVLFDHANTGGFSGAFTTTSNMRSLRNGLRENAQRIVGEVVYDVLIVEIVRQDVL